LMKVMFAIYVNVRNIFYHGGFFVSETSLNITQQLLYFTVSQDALASK